MAKGQQTQKMVKKPKKDTSSGLTKTVGTPSDRPTAPMTAVIPRGKIVKDR